MKAKENVFDMERVNLWEKVPLETPFLLIIEPTFACNFHCCYCMHSTTPKEIEKTRGYKSLPMDWETFLRTVEQAKAFPQKFKKITFAGLGEPLLYPRLPEMIKFVNENNICDKTLVISNGSLLTHELSDKLIASGLSELKISLQGLTSEKYKEVCGVAVDFDKLVENIRYFYEHRGNTKLKLKIADISLPKNNGKEQFYDIFGNICDNIAIEHIFSLFHDVDYDEYLLPNQGKNRFGFDLIPTNVCGDIFFRMSVLRDGSISFGCPDGVTYDGFNVCYSLFCYDKTTEEKAKRRSKNA